MAEILGLGVTHSPLLPGTDQRMAGILERVLQSPRLPDHLREPSSWPAPMRHEWEEHRAGRAAPRTGYDRSKGSAPPEPRSPPSIRNSW